jgi:four helix bundle protein
MKRKGTSNELRLRRRTPNAKRRTPNIEWRTVANSVNEAPGRGYGGQKYDLEERLLTFAANIVRLADSLPGTKAGNHIASQLLRCGTSPLANHGEVEAAESRNDFLHKLRICLKELRETNRWLRLIDRLGLAESTALTAAIGEVDQLIRIFVTSIRTTRGKTR